MPSNYGPPENASIKKRLSEKQCQSKKTTKLTPITIPLIAFLGYTNEDNLEFLEGKKTVPMPTQMV